MDNRPPLDLVHDVYRFILMYGSKTSNPAPLNKIIDAVKLRGQKHDKIILRQDIKQTLNYLEVKRLIKQVKKGQYVIN